MFPTYWPIDAGPIVHQNNPATTDTWIAVGVGPNVAAIAVESLSEEERQDPAVMAVTPAVLFDVLVDQLSSVGVDLPPELLAAFPRREAIPAPLQSPSVALVVVDSRELLANTVIFGSLRAFYTIDEGFWIAGLLSSATPLVLKTLQ